jgi:hypothetical protein
MKNLLKTILVIIFIPAFTITVIAALVKFQLLSPKFWKNSLSEHHAYKDLSQTIKTLAESSTVKGGGNPRDIKILTDVMTPELIQDFTERNITNILDYANGKRPDLVAYIPLDKIPKSLAPKSVGLNQEELPFASLLSKFNIGQNSIPFTQIAYFGRSVNYILIFSSVISLLIAIVLFALTDSGKHFFSIGIMFLLSGALVILLNRVLSWINVSMTKNTIPDPNFGTAMLKIIGPVILSEFLKPWSIIGAILVGIGIVIFFLKKPAQQL